MKETMDKQVAYLEFINRENSFSHHRFSDELRELELLKNGDLRALDEAKKLSNSGKSGHLSDDPLRNRLYLNICHITLCTRFAIEGGMDSEKAYNASDLFIQRCDKAKSIDELLHMHAEVTEYFTRQVAAAKKASIYSKPVIECISYINTHLHETIAVSDLAELVKLNASYLSVLFKRQVGTSISVSRPPKICCACQTFRSRKYRIYCTFHHTATLRAHSAGTTTPAPSATAICTISQCSF